MRNKKKLIYIWVPIDELKFCEIQFTLGAAG